MKKGLLVRWQQIPETIPDVSEIRQVAYANGTWFLHGIDYSNDATTAWTSADGRSWIEVDGWDEWNPLWAVVAGGPGLVATSLRGVLVSADGREWTSSNAGIPGDNEIRSQLRSLGVVNGALVAFAERGPGYWSADGASWQQLPAGSTPDGATAVASDGLRMWAFSGGYSFEQESSRPITVWTSANGVDWMPVTDLPGSRNNVEGFAAMGGPGGVLVGDSKSWFTADGSAWHSASTPPTHTASAGVFIDDVIADDAGYIVVGYLGGGGCVRDPSREVGVTWTSLDGDVWREMPERGWRGSAISALAIVDRTLMGFGVDYPSNDYPPVGATWTFELPPLAQDERPAPTPAPDPPNPGCG